MPRHDPQTAAKPDASEYLTEKMHAEILQEFLDLQTRTIQKTNATADRFRELTIETLTEIRERMEDDTEAAKRLLDVALTVLAA